MNHKYLMFFTIVIIMQGIVSKIEKMELLETSSPRVNTLSSSVFSYLISSYEQPNDINTEALLAGGAGYYIPISVGEPPQIMNAILDTGSGQMFVSSVNCQTCSNFLKKNSYDSPDGSPTFYDDKKSQTFVNLNKNMSIQYVASYVTGYLGEDKIKFNNLEIKQKFVVIQQIAAIDFILLSSCLIGLNLNKRQLSFLDIAYSQQQIISPNFAFEFNSRELKQQSYFYYNISDSDFAEAEFKRTFRTQQWTIQLQQLSIDGNKYQIEQATVDSGTTFIMLPNKIFRKIYNQYFKDLCHQTHDTQLSFAICKCNDLSKFPTLTFKISQNISLELGPQHYMQDTAEYGLYCILFLFGGGDFQALLGQAFMRHFIVIFNKQNNSIGFIKKEVKPTQKYFYNYTGHKVVVIITYTMGIICIIRILIMLKTKIQSSIRQRLLERNANMEIEIDQINSQQNTQTMQKYEKQIIQNIQQQRARHIELDTII